MSVPMPTRSLPTIYKKTVFSYKDLNIKTNTSNNIHIFNLIQ